ncbi:prepilin-type N-terminal cleavage/methylation domain-containing protein [Sulfurovum sp. zt1-1]|uniref:Prepilin-type N-terminal cleavage/methylation domain-containing protein n=1 Tax=Sulfurovum zhangzhouensis TaxID=3019067 RepID=A0ABT7R0L0_9BACT|nr:prepilin-type N-terminal cleavage/methylation domain-containing protein [Sulfurovum zhangzhouensis]MDM5272622.1 prepilin-type N-terminal cleavage/methylation domain-containing protein [Sulfurovum zhangzhouensis]
MLNRKAFTLLEVLISIALLTLVMLALNHSVAILRDSNTHLLDYLRTAKTETKVLNTLYRDIIGSDGNLTISKDEFSRLCIEETANSLYELPSAKVCWVVLKQDKTLVRIEGNNYGLPVGNEEQVEVDVLVKNLELFDIYHDKDKVLVLMKERSKEAMGFMIQGIKKYEPEKKDNNTTTPTAAQPLSIDSRTN